MPLRALLRRPLRWQWRPLRWQWRLAPPRCRAAFQSQANNSDARVPPSLSMSGALSRLSSSQHPPTQDQTHSFSPSPPTRASARAAACLLPLSQGASPLWPLRRGRPRQRQTLVQGRRHWARPTAAIARPSQGWQGRGAGSGRGAPHRGDPGGVAGR